MSRRRGGERDRRRRHRFGDVVEAAVGDLRAEVEARRESGRLSRGMAALFVQAIEAVAIVVADAPDRRQREENERADDLLGLYEGVPLTEWAADSALVPPRITIFRRAIEELSPSTERQRDEIRRTVAHEIAHHLGWSDEQLDRAGLGDVRDEDQN